MHWLYSIYCYAASAEVSPFMLRGAASNPLLHPTNHINAGLCRAPALLKPIYAWSNYVVGRCCSWMLRIEGVMHFRRVWCICGAFGGTAIASYPQCFSSRDRTDRASINWHLGLCVLTCIFLTMAADVTKVSKNTTQRECLFKKKCVFEACYHTDRIERKEALLLDQCSPFPIYSNWHICICCHLFHSLRAVQKRRVKILILCLAEIGCV